MRLSLQQSAVYCATINEAICEQNCDESGMFGSRVVVTISAAVKFDLNQQSLINKRSMTSRLEILKPLYLVRARQLDVVIKLMQCGKVT